MKKLFLSLVAVLALAASSVHATDSYGRMTVTSATGGLFYTNPNTVPVTYTATSCVGPGIIATKLTISNSSTTTAAVFTLWDAPQGVTSSALARDVETFTIVSSVPWTYDFAYAAPSGSANGPAGLPFKYFPVIVNASAATPTATLQYVPGLQNRVVIAK